MRLATFLVCTGCLLAACESPDAQQTTHPSSDPQSAEATAEVPGYAFNLDQSRNYEGDRFRTFWRIQNTSPRPASFTVLKYFEQLSYGRQTTVYCLAPGEYADVGPFPIDRIPRPDGGEVTPSVYYKVVGSYYPSDC